MDQKFTKALTPDNHSLSKFNLQNGDLIHLQGTTASWEDPNKKEVKKEDAKTDPKAKCNHSERETCINCIEKIKKLKEEKEKEKGEKKVEVPKKDAKAIWDDLVANDKKKKKVVVQEKKEPLPSIWEKMGLTKNCNHGPGQKCLHCMAPVVPGESI